MRTDRIKSHFEDEAKEFDNLIIKLIPDYNKMLGILRSIIHFPQNSSFSIIDLGCGTGSVSKAIKDIFPEVNITCVDISIKMLEIAKNKIGEKIICIEADFNHFEFANKYDIIVYDKYCDLRYFGQYFYNHANNK